ncbi:unnamed protein product [Pleuronectes platessa]|uniref:Uncharacterized protein n=1 Tax=Pleuronectes platessa TaxID=8262 RepID=A0A9N7U4F2_PLEPL|nr:unnamed protein product [Pleuronectes platessa]
MLIRCVSLHRCVHRGPRRCSWGGGGGGGWGEGGDAPVKLGVQRIVLQPSPAAMISTGGEDERITFGDGEAAASSADAQRRFPVIHARPSCLLCPVISSDSPMKRARCCVKARGKTWSGTGDVSLHRRSGVGGLITEPH